jgi:cytochrome c
MKSVLIVAVAALFTIAGNASANEALAQKSGCMKCHDIEKNKKGPSFKASAAKYKGKQAELVKEWKENHEDVKISDGDLNTLMKWVLSL